MFEMASKLVAQYAHRLYAFPRQIKIVLAGGGIKIIVGDQAYKRVSSFIAEALCLGNDKPERGDSRVLSARTGSNAAATKQNLVQIPRQ